MNIFKQHSKIYVNYFLVEICCECKTFHFLSTLLVNIEMWSIISIHAENWPKLIVWYVYFFQNFIEQLYVVSLYLVWHSKVLLFLWREYSIVRTPWHFKKKIYFPFTFVSRLEEPTLFARGLELYKIIIYICIGLYA